MTEESVEEFISQSRLAFLQGRYELSLKLAKEILNIEPQNADAHQCAGNAYMSYEDYETAIKHYKQAVECDPDNGDRYFNLGYAYATNNESAEALAMFAKADEVGCSPNVIGQLYKIMAMLCFDMQRYNDAILNFIKAEKIIGLDMDILQRKALSYSMCGETSAGIEVANQMKLLAPTDYLGYRIAFNILLQEERLEESEKELDRAERFAKLSSELFYDWVTYESARYKIDGEEEHLETAIQKIHEGLCMMQPNANEVVDCYLNAAEAYVQLENFDMTLKCLNAAENPVQSYNEGFTVVVIPESEMTTVRKPTDREINQAVEAVRRKYGDRRLESTNRRATRATRKTRKDAEQYMTPLADESDSASEEKEAIYRIDDNSKAEYSSEKMDQIYRLYVAAYTLNNDTGHIKMYAAKLANSEDSQSRYIGKYSLVKAEKDEGQTDAEQEYRDLLKYLRNEMIKNPSDLFALSIRVQCHVDLGEYDEAEKLCLLLSDDLKRPLMEQINKARSGGEV